MKKACLLQSKIDLETNVINQEQMKQLAGEYAIRYVSEDMVVGVGTGSTVKHFINKLASMRDRIKGAVPSSEQSAILLRQNNIEILELNNVSMVDVYIDGADEINHYKQMIKGGGGALTREKIIAAASRKFVCIIDESKYLTKLGTFPLPIEVIPMARSYVAREIVKLGGMPDWRTGFITDNGNYILDVHNLDILEPMKMEEMLNNITGVVTVGLFAKRGADEIVIAKSDGSVLTI